MVANINMILKQAENEEMRTFKKKKKLKQNLEEKKKKVEKAISDLSFIL